MTIVYSLDLTAQPTQAISGPGALTIDGRTWYAKGTINSDYTRGLLNGSGLYVEQIAGFTNCQIGSSGTLTGVPSFFQPFTQVPELDASAAYLVRARFAYAGAGAVSNIHALFGVADTTSDSADVLNTQRYGDRLVAPRAGSGSQIVLAYKIGTAGVLTTGSGRHSATPNDQCVVGIYHPTPRFAAFGAEALVSGMPSGFATWLPHAASLLSDHATVVNPGLFFFAHYLVPGGPNHRVYLQHVQIEQIGDVNDTSDPVVTLLSPPTTQALGRHEAIRVRVQDETSLRRHYLWAEYDYGTEVIYAGDHFTPRFAALSSVSGSDTDKTFVIRRSGGWLKSPTLHVEPIDAGGNHG